MGLSEDPEEALREIYRLKDEGRLFAQLEGKRVFVLMLYELYPNGTTSETFIDDPAIAAAIGVRTGLGPPTDRQGWGIWVVTEEGGVERDRS